MSDLQWIEPPSKGRRGAKPGKWSEIANTLRGNPGAWALVSGEEGSSGSRARAMPADEYDVTSRVREDGRYDVYARYVGDAEA